MSQTITGIIVGVLLLFVVLYSCIRSAKDGEIEDSEKKDSTPIDKKE